MRKLHRSMLWTGLVVAGVAACGDDVTVNPPTATVHSISVAPNGVTVGIGANIITMSAAVNADAGVTNLGVTWSTSDATKASVSQTGQVTTLAAGSVAIIACSQLVPSVCGNATLTISSTAATVTSVTITPNAPTIVRGNTQQLVAAVVGTNNPAQTVTWQPSPNPAIATVSATGLVTTTAASQAGTVPITACSTAAPTVCGSAAVTVTIPAPATISILSITQGTLNTPVTLTNVGGQIEISLNVDNGDQNLTKVQALIGGVVVGEQTFSQAAPINNLQAPGAGKLQQVVVISVNTAQVRAVGNNFVPVVFDGQNVISARLFTTSNVTGIASDTRNVTMNNNDVMLSPDAFAATSATGSVVAAGGFTWFKNGGTLADANYVAYSGAVPTAVSFGSAGSAACGAAAGTISGTPTTGIDVDATWSCAGVEGTHTPDGTFTVTQGAAPSPEITVPPAPTVFSDVGPAYVVDGENRYNVLTPDPTPTAFATIRVDNKGPVVTPNEIGFMVGCSATIPTPGCWVGSAYNLPADFVRVDAGSGNTTNLAGINTFVYDPSIFPNVCTNVSLTIAGSPELASPTAYNACAVATDAIGNPTTAFGFNSFGIDKTNPTITYATNSGTLYAPNSTLDEVVPAQELNWSVNDNNAGLDTATAVSVSTVGTTLNGVCAISINGALDAEPAPGAARFLLSGGFAPDAGCALPGYYYYLATVSDRAGNTASDGTTRVFGLEPGVPTILALAPVPLYGGGQQASLNVFASHTGASLSAAKMGIWYTTDATAVELVFDQGQLFNAPFQVPLFLSTPAAGTTLSVAAGSALAGLVIDSTAAPTSAFDSVTAIIQDVFDASLLTGGLVHADTADLALPAPFIDPTKISTDAAVWANPAMGAATFSGAGACTFTYATPTNGPTIPTSVLVVRTIVANIYDVLFPIVAAPTLLSDNGTTRLYRYSVSGSTCASFGGTLRLIAVKNDVNGLPVGYLVP
jgi:uncharacterized protein YjdB